MRTMTDLKLSICYGNMAACFTTVCRPMLSVDDVDTAGVTFDTHELDSSNHHISFGYTLYPMMIENMITSGSERRDQPFLLRVAVTHLCDDSIVKPNKTSVTFL